MRSFLLLLVLTLATGIAAGAGAIAFLWLIDVVLTFFYGDGDFAVNVNSLPLWRDVMIPTAGGFLVGLLVMMFHRKDIAGEGVPQVLDAVEKKHSRMHLLSAPLKILTTAITLGSGGSAGKEGPIVQIGATIGATIGSWTKRGERDRRLLLAAGAAAGIAGVFSAPIAGVIFSLELIIKRVTVHHTILLIVAALVSTSLVRWYGVDTISIPLSALPALDWYALALSIPLGAIAGVIAIIFGFSLFLATVLFNHYQLPVIIPSTIGGFMVGLIGAAVPYIHEPMAHPLMIDLLSLSTLPVLLIITIVIGKILATGITLGSGSSGGVFAPALLIGTLLGSLYASLIGMFGIADPGITTTLLLVGMAAFFAGITHAPFTAVIILVELTKEPTVLPAIAVATFVGYLTAKLIHHESVYTEHLDRNRGYFEELQKATKGASSQ